MQIFSFKIADSQAYKLSFFGPIQEPFLGCKV
uniref:Uncharacterized protein n=1 Tax=Solanum lycopersicum TaxID=4081 RepID=A0A3Q7HN00_SOLLC